MEVLYLTKLFMSLQASLLYYLFIFLRIYKIKDDYRNAFLLSNVINVAVVSHFL